MSDLEQRLVEALEDAAHAAPSSIGLAAGARERARRRRRARIGGAAALVVLAVGVPGAVVVASGDDDPDHGAGPAGSADDAPAPAGYRWESWHGVTVQVPEGWVHGSLSDGCVDGDGAESSEVERPGRATGPVLCEPDQAYGLVFQEIDNRDDFQWPVVQQRGQGWPEGSYSGGRGIGGVLVTVTTRTSAEASYLLYSMHAIPATGDANGCQYRLRPDANAPPEGGVSVCRYDEQGQLEQSEALLGEDAGRAVRAMQAAPEPGECADTSRGAQPHRVVVLTAAGLSARVDLVEGCPRVSVDSRVRELTPEVLYWALSPGWTGSLPDGLALPDVLRD
jgi:hypothetical protein